MKRLSIISSLLLLSCTKTEEKKVVFNYKCERPEEIPDTLVGGYPVYWDCDWHASYVNGRVSLERDSLSRITAVKRILK
jgi:hypothetical protein